MEYETPKYWAMWFDGRTPRFQIYKFVKFDLASETYYFLSRTQTVAALVGFNIFQLTAMIDRNEFKPFLLQGGKNATI